MRSRRRFRDESDYNLGTAFGRSPFRPLSASRQGTVPLSSPGRVIVFMPRRSLTGGSEPLSVLPAGGRKRFERERTCAKEGARANGLLSRYPRR
jgi:hypothetical protein